LKWELFREAYGKAATVQNATSGFAKSGIFPLNDSIFTEEDFVVAEMTERPDPDAITDGAAAESDSVCRLWFIDLSFYQVHWYCSTITLHHLY